MNREEMRKFMLEKPCRWVGRKISKNNMKMVSQYSEDNSFCCEYDGKSLGDEIETSDIDKALDWLFS